QNGLTRAGLAGEDGHAAIERQVKLVDKDNVANRERVQHARLIPKLRPPGGADLVLVLPSGRQSRESENPPFAQGDSRRYRTDIEDSARSRHAIHTNEPGRILAPRNKLATNYFGDATSSTRPSSCRC